VSQPIFTGGALRGNLRRAKSVHEQALIAYKQSIQHAFGDASDALIGYQKFHEVRVRQENTVADLQESVRLSNMRYAEAQLPTSKFSTINARCSQAELTLAQARGTEYQKPGATLPGTWRRLAATVALLGARGAQQMRGSTQLNRLPCLILFLLLWALPSVAQQPPAPAPEDLQKQLEQLKKQYDATTRD